MRNLKAINPLTIWILTKIVFLLLWVWIGMWIGSKAGLAGLIPFALVIGLYQISDFWNQYLISRASKAIKRQIIEENLKGEERQRNLRWLSQVEAKRNLISAIHYLLNRAGRGEVPKSSFQIELSDFAPFWIRRHILWTMMLTESYIVPFILKGYLPPVKKAIKKIVENKGVFVGLSVGCGFAKFEQVLAEWCNKERIPAVIFALDNQSGILEETLERMKKCQGFWVTQHNEGKVNIDSLTQEAREKIKPIICLICDDAVNLRDLFGERTIDLVWALHTKHHFQNWQGIMAPIKDISKEWIILEELRSWTLLFSQYLGCWFYSRLLLCDAENSVLAGQTKEEWEEELGGEGKLVTAKPSYEAWIMSNSLHRLLKEEGVIT